MLLSLPLAGIGVVAAYLGIDAFAGWLTRQVMGAIDPVLGLGMLGVALIVLPATGMFMVITRRSRTGVTLLTMLGCGSTALVMAVLGAWALFAALTSRPGTPGF